MVNHFNKEKFQATAKAIAADPQTGVLPFHAKFSWKDGLVGNVNIRNFSPLTLDEPQELGGTNKGPNPVEYLMTGIAGCFSLGIVIGASLEGVTIQDLKTEVDANLDMGVFFDAVHGGRHGIGDVAIKLYIKSDASKEQLDAMVRHSLAYSPVINSLNITVKAIVVQE
ncbi:OsmC family protein [Acidaminococcus fermentans]|uniref:OsmC family protein n=1 Tax=Acidaminococcus fermentans TaxID=905 RepID=UPI002E7A2985|nr:OsmC family protein [Acidaminococcus fermentans]MEE1598815.1 OsmC family protein [Acidaminococcus fermentans]MEE4123077.1 OsmC family protein [Acidaminococcus fermentans]